MESMVLLDGAPQEGGAKQVLEWKTNGRCRLLIEQSEAKGDSIGNLWAMNEKYAFAFTRASPNAPWAVTLTEPVSSGGAERIRNRLDLYEHYAQVLIAIDREFLPEVAGREEFRTKNIQVTTRDGQEYVEVKFDYPNAWKANAAGVYNPVQGGVLVLDPRRFWTLQSLELKLKSSTGEGIRRMTMEIGELEDGLPICKKCVSQDDWRLNSNQRMVITSTAKNDFFLPAHLPADEEFRLSYFGFPEPPGMDFRRPVAWYLWVGSAALLCVLLGAGFYWLRRRAA
jgi:hypothetical protein